MEHLGTPFYDFMLNHGVTPLWATIIRTGVLLTLLFIVTLILNFAGRGVFLKIVTQFTKKTSSNVDDVFLRNKVFYKITLLFPALGFYMFDSLFLAHAKLIQPILLAAANIYTIAIVAMIISAALKAVEEILNNTPSFKDKPLTSYRQLINIFNYGVAIILIVSIIVDKSPMYLLSALGAATAVLLLIFRDSLLGFTASIQLASNDMVRIGDWVTVEKYGADGDVTEITLNTVKVRNFDKTITTVPTYAFVSNSFKNWRGMEESKGRRIKRSVSVKIDSIKFADEQLLKQLKSVELLEPFLDTRIEEIQAFNANKNTEVPINGRRQTNVGLFRKYIELYLKNNPKVTKELTIMVRQLAADNHGLPLEIYCFSADKVWLNYEGIMADIFDHVYAAAPYFDIEIFQSPSGQDFKEIR